MSVTYVFEISYCAICLAEFVTFFNVEDECLGSCFLDQ